MVLADEQKKRVFCCFLFKEELKFIHTQYPTLQTTLKEVIMAGQIFYRERSKLKEGAHSPRFRIVAISGIDMKIYGNHFRKKELEQLAKVSGAELVALVRDKDSKNKK